MTSPATTPAETFAWLIAPICPTRFEREFYERELCILSRTDADYFARLLKIRDLDVALGTHNVTPHEINVVRGDDRIPRDTYTYGSGAIDPLAVARLFDEGATVIFNQFHRRIPALGELCSALGKVFSSRLQTNIYLTPPDAQGFKTHWDTHDVFVLQVLGRKHWSVYDTKVTLPLRGQTFERNSDSPGPVTAQFELGPGDGVYIPRGLIHSARSSSEASLHITLGVTTFTWVDFFIESVASAALRESLLRRSLPMRFTDESFPTEACQGLVQEKLDLLVSRLVPSEVWQHFRLELLSSNTPLFTDLWSSRLCAESTTLASRWRKRRGLRVELRNRADDCVLCFCGKEMQFPRSMLPVVHFVANADTFSVSDIPDSLDDEKKVAVVRRLVREGFLQAETDQQAE